MFGKENKRIKKNNYVVFNSFNRYSINPQKTITFFETKEEVLQYIGTNINLFNVCTIIDGELKEMKLFTRVELIH